MSAIEFTQFIRPSGRTTSVTIDRPDEIAALATNVRAAGGRFECEVLSTGEVSFEIVREVIVDGTPETESLASEIVENGPEVIFAVDRLVRRAAERITPQ